MRLGMGAALATAIAALAAPAHAFTCTGGSSATATKSSFGQATVPVQASPGDVIQFTLSNPASAQAGFNGNLICSWSGFPRTCNATETYTVPAKTPSVPVNVTLSDSQVVIGTVASNTISITNCGGSPVVPTPTTPTTPTTPGTPTTPATPSTPTAGTPAGTPQAPQGPIAKIDALRRQLLSIAAQAQGGGAGTGAAIRAAIASFRTQIGNGFGIANTGGALTFGTRGTLDASTDRVFDAWASIDGTRLGGDADGSGIGLSFGAHVALSEATILGLALSYESFEIEAGGQTLDSEAVLIGPYLSHAFGAGLVLDASLLYGRPDYDFGGGLTAEGERLIYDARILGRRALGAVSVTPYAGLSGYREDTGAVGGVAASDARQDTLSLGARVDFAPRDGLGTYVSGGLDAYRFEGAGTSSESLAPAVSAGLSYDAGSGRFGVDLSYSEVAEGVRAGTISLGYDLSF